MKSNEMVEKYSAFKAYDCAPAFISESNLTSCCKFPKHFSTSLEVKCSSLGPEQ